MDKSSLEQSILRLREMKNFDSEESLIRTLASSCSFSERFIREQIREHGIVLDLTPIKVEKRRGRVALPKIRKPNALIQSIFDTLRKSVEESVVSKLETHYGANTITPELIESIKLDFPIESRSLLYVLVSSDEEIAA